MTHLIPLAARLQLALAADLGALIFFGKDVLGYFYSQLQTTRFLKQTKFPLFQIKIHSSDIVQKRLQSNITWEKGILTQPLLSQEYFSSRKQQPTTTQRPQEDRPALQSPHFTGYELIPSKSQSTSYKKSRSLKPRSSAQAVLPTKLPFRFTQCPERNFQSRGALCGDSVLRAEPVRRAAAGRRDARPGPQTRRSPCAPDPRLSPSPFSSRSLLAAAGATSARPARRSRTAQARAARARRTGAGTGTGVGMGRGTGLRSLRLFSFLVLFFFWFFGSFSVKDLFSSWNYGEVKPWKAYTL